MAPSLECVLTGRSSKDSRRSPNSNYRQTEDRSTSKSTASATRGLKDTSLILRKGKVPVLERPVKQGKKAKVFELEKQVIQY